MAILERPLPGSRRRRVPRPIAYRRILVPVVDREISDQAMEIACGLAAERRASITAVGVVEVPAELPLDAHMVDEEAELKPVLDDARAIADLYGVSLEARTLRGRAAGETIVEEAERGGSEIIVVTARRRRRTSRRGPVFGGTVEHVLTHAPCRVMVAAGPPRG